MKKLLSFAFCSMSVILILISNSASQGQILVSPAGGAAPVGVSPIPPAKSYLVTRGKFSSPRPHRHFRPVVRCHIRPIRTKRYRGSGDGLIPLGA